MIIWVLLLSEGQAGETFNIKEFWFCLQRKHKAFVCFSKEVIQEK